MIKEVKGRGEGWTDKTDPSLEETLKAKFHKCISLKIPEKLHLVFENIPNSIPLALVLITDQLKKPPILVQDAQFPCFCLNFAHFYFKKKYNRFHTKVLCVFFYLPPGYFCSIYLRNCSQKIV